MKRRERLDRLDLEDALGWTRWQEQGDAQRAA